MGLGGVVSGFMGAKGSNKASKQAQLYAWLAQQALDKGYKDVKGMYQPYQEDTQPFWDSYLNTIQGDTSSFDASPWGQSYNQYVMDNTINNLQGTAAARGSLQSGNTLKELQTNIQSILSNDYLNRLNNYLSYTGDLANQNLNLMGQQADLRWQQAGGTANTLNNIGQLKAAGTMSKYQQLGNAWGGLTDQFVLTPRDIYNGVVSIFGGSGNNASSGANKSATTLF